MRVYMVCVYDVQMSIDLKFVELTADVLEIFFIKYEYFL